MNIYVPPRRPSLAASAKWWMEGAALDFDYTNGPPRFYLNGAQGNDPARFVTATRATPHLLDRVGGTIASFANNELAVTDRGAYIGDQATNKCESFNAAPTDETGLSPGATTLSFPASAAAAAIAPGIVTSVCRVTNGDVVERRVVIQGFTGNLNQHSASIYLRAESGTARLADSFNNATLGAPVTSSEFQKIEVNGFTPDGVLTGLAVNVTAGGAAEFFLNQLEENAFVTPPIVTAGAAAVRNATNASASFAFPEAFTLFKEIEITHTDTVDRWLSLAFLSADDRIGYRINSTGTVRFLVRVGAANVIDIQTVETVSAGTLKIAARVESGSVRLAVTGMAPVTSATVFTTPALNTLYLGSFVGSSAFFDDYPWRDTVFPTGLSNDEMDNLIAA